jgi:4-hydroxy-3-methylbut-2-enyl diphosphate reductase IspH
VIDTTCPIVTRSQRWAKKMTEAGFTVVIFGDPNHRSGGARTGRRHDRHQDSDRCRRTCRPAWR